MSPRGLIGRNAWRERRPRFHAGADFRTRDGYNGERIVVIAPTDLPGMRSLSLVGSDQLRRAGVNIDLQEMDFGSVIRRRNNQSPPDKGGWNVFFTFIDRSIPNTHPFGNPALRADGKAAYDGWPTSQRIEELRRDWLDAGELGEQRRIAAELQMQVWQDVRFIPMGEYWQTEVDPNRETAGAVR